MKAVYTWKEGSKSDQKVVVGIFPIVLAEIASARSLAGAKIGKDMTIDAVEIVTDAEAAKLVPRVGTNDEIFRPKRFEQLLKRWGGTIHSPAH